MVFSFPLLWLTLSSTPLLSAIFRRRLVPSGITSDRLILLRTAPFRLELSRLCQPCFVAPCVAYNNLPNITTIRVFVSTFCFPVADVTRLGLAFGFFLSSYGFMEATVLAQLQKALSKTDFDTITSFIILYNSFKPEEAGQTAVAFKFFVENLEARYRTTFPDYHKVLSMNPEDVEQLLLENESRPE